MPETGRQREDAIILSLSANVDERMWTRSQLWEKLDQFLGFIGDARNREDKIRTLRSLKFLDGGGRGQLTSWHREDASWFDVDDVFAILDDRPLHDDYRDYD
jgi:hypothetical protein